MTWNWKNAGKGALIGLALVFSAGIACSFMLWALFSVADALKPALGIWWAGVASFLVVYGILAAVVGAVLHGGRP